MWSWLVPATTLQVIPAPPSALEKAAVRPTACRSELTVSVI